MPERVLVIGGGPAGQAAALTLTRHRIPVAVIDEQRRPGGQILRQPSRGSGTPAWMRARAYAEARGLLADFIANDAIEWLGGRSVIGLARDGDGWLVTVSGEEGVSNMHAAHVLIATGCQDLAVPLPGWTLPGAYTAGALQTLLKGQALVPGRRVVLAGTHPLLLIVGHQLIASGVDVAAVLFAQPVSRLLRGRSAGTAAIYRRNDLAASLSALAALGARVRFGARLCAINGSDAVSEVGTSNGMIACDTVGVSYGFVPQSALPRMAGAQMRPAGLAGGFACVANEWMASSCPGLWVAGEAAGVGGAGAAAAEGRIAALGIARAVGRIDDPVAIQEAAAPRRAQRRHRRFAAALEAVADPTGLFPAMTDDTIICRCEDVARSAIEPVHGSANAIKLATRCGMGLCQGRNCEPTLLRLGNDPNDPGFTARFPARPVAIGDLAAPA